MTAPAPAAGVRIVSMVECPHCGAPVGRPCVRSEGQPRKRPHQRRKARFRWASSPSASS